MILGIPSALKMPFQSWSTFCRHCVIKMEGTLVSQVKTENSSYSAGEWMWPGGHEGACPSKAPPTPRAVLERLCLKFSSRELVLLAGYSGYSVPISSLYQASKQNTLGHKMIEQIYEVIFLLKGNLWLYRGIKTHCTERKVSKLPLVSWGGLF